MQQGKISKTIHWISGDTQNTGSVELPLDCCVNQTGKNIRRVIVTLHGYGDNASNFASVSDEMGLKDVLWVNLQAPEALPFPSDGGQWYELFGNPHTQLRSSLSKVETVLNIVQRELRINWSQIILFGFSQGAFISLHSALEFQHQLGAVVALSGYLAQAHRIVLPKPQRKQLPIFIAHGMHDQVIFPAQHFETLDILNTFGCTQVTAKTYKAVAHSLCAEELFDIRTFVEGLP